MNNGGASRRLGLPLLALGMLSLGCSDDSMATTGTTTDTGAAGSTTGSAMDSSTGSSADSDSTTGSSTDPDSGSEDTGEPSPVAGVSAFHLTMPDGVQIAVDLWLPAAVEDGATVPTLVQSTRYWRAVDLLPGAPPGIDANLELAQAANDIGYAVLLIDARGSGASFGDRQIPWSSQEQDDHGQIVRWALDQPWSNQRAVAWGISYDGNTADLLPAQELDGLVAIAPLFSDYDPYLAIARPGGLVHEGFLQTWSAVNAGLDANDICVLVPPGQCEGIGQVATGVKPVDEDGPALLEAAVEDHATNVDVFAAITEAPFRDSTFADSGVTLSDMAPYAQQAALGRANVPTFAVGSWMDGSTARSALQRFQTLHTPQQVVIGTWNHAASSDGDPFVPFVQPDVPPIVEIIGEMFGVLTPLALGAPPRAVQREVRYFVMNGGGWQTTEDWPPPGVSPQAWYFGSGGTLVDSEPVGDQIDAYAVDFTATTGQTNRWFTQLGEGIPVIYGDRAEEDAKLLTYTSAPFEDDVDLVGQSVVDLYVDVSVPDAAFHAYLEVVDADGVVTYVSEGQIAGVHRTIDEGAPPYAGMAVHHSFSQADATPMVVGEVNHVRFELQPTAVRIHSGQRVRIALAGHDAGNFERVPDAGPVDWQLHRAAAWPSRITLPIVTP